MCEREGARERERESVCERERKSERVCVREREHVGVVDQDLRRHHLPHREGSVTLVAMEADKVFSL